MEVDVVIDMVSASLVKFHDDTTIYWKLEEEYFKTPSPDSGYLAMWFVEQLIDDHRYAGTSELSKYRHTFKASVERKNSARLIDKREDKPVWCEEHVDKLLWTFDIFLMEMASNYIEN